MSSNNNQLLIWLVISHAMIKLCVVALLAASASASQVISFAEFAAHFQRNYKPGSAEYVLRESIYHQRVADVNAHNSRNAGWTKTVNRYSDWTDEELQDRLLGYKRTSLTPALASAPRQTLFGDASLLPKSVDWRNKSVLSAIKDQGHCGSCWAFSATATIESHVAIATGDLFDLSPQQIVACVDNPHHCGGDGGCSGATEDLAFEHVAKHGLAESFTWGYESYWGTTNGTCNGPSNKRPAVVQIDGYQKVDSNNVTAVMEAVSKGPITVSVDASSWHSYGGGIFEGCPSGDQNVDINHAVQLVGYGTDNGKDYWLVRNSWSASWGEHGYIRIARRSTPACGIDRTPLDGSGCEGGPSQVTVCGECGILFDTSYPTGARVL